VPRRRRPGRGLPLLVGTALALAAVPGLGARVRPPGMGLGALSAAVGDWWPAPSGPGPRPLAEPVAPPRLLHALGPFGRASGPVRRFAWPLRPFHRQHPIRATFGEPRGILGLDLGGLTHIARAEELIAADQVAPAGLRVLHTGVDIAAPDGTPVYAVASGRAVVGGSGYARHVIVGGFGYWHLAGTVAPGTRVVAFRTVIGHVYPGQHHVHLTRFAYGDLPVNPLRFGGLTPYRDRARPVVSALRAFDAVGRDLPAQALRGPVVLSVQAYDRQSVGGMHTGVYRMRYEILPRRGDRPVVGPYETVRFDALPPPAVAGFIYTVGSTRHGLLTRFRYRLTVRSPSGDGLLHTESLAPGPYRLVVRVADERGNTARRVFGIRILPPWAPAR
jgi:hypothetical protein